MQVLLGIVIVIAAIAIVSVSFFNDIVNTEFLGEDKNEFTDENVEALAEDFIIEASKAQRILDDPDGIPNSGDEQFITKYEGCTFNNVEEAYEKCKVTTLRVIEKMEDGSCIGTGPWEEKNYDIGPCDGKVGELVMAVIEP